MKYKVKEVEEVVRIHEVEADSPEQAENIVNEGLGGNVIEETWDGNMRSVEVLLPDDNSIEKQLELEEKIKSETGCTSVSC